MTVSVDMGVGPGGDPITIDLEELLATRLLVQGNSGSGKSHLLRRLLERSAAEVQQIVIDPEGDFVTLVRALRPCRGRGGRLCDKRHRPARRRASASIARRSCSASRGSRPRARCAAPRRSCRACSMRRASIGIRRWWWSTRRNCSRPSGGGEVAEEVRRASLGAMTNLMCRGRKRGLAGVIATQRLAKLAKNVAAEASQLPDGADLPRHRHGARRRSARHGAAPGRGDPRSAARHLPRARPGDRAAPGGGGDRRGRDAGALDEPQADPAAGARPTICRNCCSRPAPERAAAAAAARRPGATAVGGLARAHGGVDPVARRAAARQERRARPRRSSSTVLRAIVEDEIERRRARRPCCSRISPCAAAWRGLPRPPLDLPDFTRRLSMARAGIYDVEDGGWHGALDAARALPDDMLGPFLLVARAARDGAPCPSRRGDRGELRHRQPRPRAAADPIYREPRPDRQPHRSVGQEVDRDSRASAGRPPSV